MQETEILTNKYHDENSFCNKFGNSCFNEDTEDRMRNKLLETELQDNEVLLHKHDNNTYSKIEIFGYACIFLTKDKHNDIFLKNSICYSDKDTPLLFNHFKNAAIGIVNSINTNCFGLYIKATIIKKNSPMLFNAIVRALKADSVGLSIGYTVSKYNYKKTNNEKIRLIHSAKLYEISIVQTPSNAFAKIHYYNFY